MASIKFSEKLTAGKLEYVEAEYDGKKIRLDVYGGDTRTDEVKAIAIRACLDYMVKEQAIKDGTPLPDEVK